MPWALPHPHLLCVACSNSRWMFWQNVEVSETKSVRQKGREDKPWRLKFVKTGMCTYRHTHACIHQ